MFTVYESGIPARYPYFNIHESWKKCSFDTFEEAFAYAQKWLGIYEDLHLELNKPVDYSGYGSTIEIREE